MAQGSTTREDIGKYLDENYGGPDQVDQHIDVFSIRIGDPIAQDSRIQRDLDFESLLRSGGIWRKTGGLFFGEFPKQGQESERERENRLNYHFTTVLKHQIGTLAYDRNNIHIMFHRACRYTNHSVAVERGVTKEEIGVILRKECNKSDDQNSHIDFFYIIVQKENTDKELDIQSPLKDLPGNWKKVEPQATWPDTFIGYFPKETPFETEREREKRLNKTVRIPLKQELVRQINIPPNPSGQIHIILTRACKYT